MSSANGYILNIQGKDLTASWSAPYFCLVLDNWDEPDPMLFHCENLECARSHGGIILDANFVEVMSA